MTSLCSGREKVRHVRSDVNVNAKKFAQRGKNGLKIAVHGTLGEFFRENAAGVPMLGELCRARGQMRLVLGELCRARGRMCFVLGELCRARGQMRLVLGECCRAQGTGVFFWVTGR